MKKETIKTALATIGVLTIIGVILILLGILFS